MRTYKMGKHLYKGVYRPWLLAVTWQLSVCTSDTPPVLHLSKLKHLPYLEYFGLHLFVVAVTSFQQQHIIRNPR